MPRHPRKEKSYMNSLNVTYTPDEFADLVSRHKGLLNFPILLRGAHGIGKSAAPRALAKALGYPLIERRISQMSEGDLIGLPIQRAIENTEDYHPLEFTAGDSLDPGTGMNSSTSDFVPTATTAFSPPDWFWQACTKPVILFLDEVGRGTHELRQAVMQLLDSRTLAGMVLHRKTILIAADNSGEDENMASYNVQPMDPALLSRFCVFDITLTKDSWLKWANGRIRPEITKFIRTCAGNIANEPYFPLYLQSNQVNRVEPCPRSWERLNTILAPILDSQGYRNREPATLHDIMKLSVPFIGSFTASELVNALREKDDLLTHEDIVLRGKFPDGNAEIPYLQSLVQGIISSFSKKKLKKPEAVNIAEFIVMLPDELASTLYWGFATTTSASGASSASGGKSSSGGDITRHNCSGITGKDPATGATLENMNIDPLTGELRDLTPLIRAKVSGILSSKVTK